MTTKPNRGWLIGGLVIVAGFIAFLANITTIFAFASSMFRAPEPSKVDMSGQWYVKLLTESSRVAGHRGMDLSYGISILDINGIISGEGTLVCENNRDIYGAEMRRVVVAGSYKGDRLMLHWTEYGRHDFQVNLDLQLKDGQGAGIFSSSVARETGRAAIVRRHETLACIDRN